MRRGLKRLSTRSQEKNDERRQPRRPGSDEICEAFRKAIRDDHRLLLWAAEEVVPKELVRGGYLHEELPAPWWRRCRGRWRQEREAPQPQGPRPATPEE
jgi:hypothetical protein